MPLPDPLKSYRLYLAMFLLNLAVVLGVIYLLRRDPPRPIVVSEPPVRPATTNPQKSESAVATRVPDTPAVNNLTAPTAPVETAVPAVSNKINLNTATLAELDALPGIGPALAQRILDYRAQIGGFTSISQLIDVRGIGETMFNDLKELVTVP